MREKTTEYLSQAAQALSENDPQGAARWLRFASQDPALQGDEQAFEGLLTSVAGIGGQMQMADLEQKAQGALSGSPQALYDLGYQLIEVGLPKVAVPVLQRLNEGLPGKKAVVSELACALERSGRHGEAKELLATSPAILEDFWMRYLLVFNAFCAGDIETARAHLPQLKSGEMNQVAAGARVQAMSDRARSLEGEPVDLRDWQYILNGTLLIHLSPFGFNEGMSGRYAYGGDSVVSIRRDLDRLIGLLDAQGKRPKVVYSLPEQGSRIVAGALARALSVPVVPWSEHDSREGLVAVYALKDLPEQQKQLSEGMNSLFARVLHWTDPPGVVPEYTGLLAQTWVAPWGEGLRIEEGKTVQKPASREPDAHWIQEILGADPTDEASEGEEIAPRDTLAELLAFGARAIGSPSDMFEEGPIRSSRFG